MNESYLDQPEPKINTEDPLWPQVIDDVTNIAFPKDLAQEIAKDMQERHEVGVKRYGTALQPYNGRNPVVDAYQEVLDSIVYLKQALIEERGMLGDDQDGIEYLYKQSIQTAMALRYLLNEGTIELNTDNWKK